jgi:acetyl-CoA acetyltransferase
MGYRKVAIVGAGITKFVRRAQETGKELSWQAAKRCSRAG